MDIKLVKDGIKEIMADREAMVKNWENLEKLYQEEPEMADTEFGKFALRMISKYKNTDKGQLQAFSFVYGLLGGDAETPDSSVKWEENFDHERGAAWHKANLEEAQQDAMESGDWVIQALFGGFGGDCDGDCENCDSSEDPDREDGWKVAGWL